jgi:hypothetical protein
MAKRTFDAAARLKGIQAALRSPKIAKHPNLLKGLHAQLKKLQGQ